MGVGLEVVGVGVGSDFIGCKAHSASSAALRVSSAKGAVALRGQ